MTPAAILYNPTTNQTLSFTGVTNIKHSHTLKVLTDTDNTATADIIHNARNEPDKLTVSVITSDTDTDPIQVFNDLLAMKESRSLLQLITPLKTYTSLLLTDLTVTRDDKVPCGWFGTLTFQHTVVQNTSSGSTAIQTTSSGSTTVTGKTANNTSTAKNIATAGTTTTTTPVIVAKLSGDGPVVSLLTANNKIRVLK